MRKYIIIILSLLCMNVYANDMEAELGEHPYVNTNTMKAARYLCHLSFTFLSKHPEIVKQKDEHLPHKVAALSSHCAKGNFHQAFMDSGLADVVNLNHYSALNQQKLIGGPGSLRPVQIGTRKLAVWEWQAITQDTLMHTDLINKGIIKGVIK